MATLTGITEFLLQVWFCPRARTIYCKKLLKAQQLNKQQQLGPLLHRMTLIWEICRHLWMPSWNPLVLKIASTKRINKPNSAPCIWLVSGQHKPRNRPCFNPMIQQPWISHRTTLRSFSSHKQLCCFLPPVEVPESYTHPLLTLLL